MRIVITGSSGQIGTNLALRCMALGHEVIGIDRRPNPWSTAFSTLLADLTSATAVPRSVAASRDLLGPPDAIVHLAAHAKVHELVEMPQRALENIAMAQHALELCRALGAPIVLASSREVYGDVERERTRESDASFVAGTSPYAASKLASESMVHAYTACYGVTHLIVRLSNVYGRYDNDLERLPRVIPLFIARIRDRQSVTVFGADKIVDFTYIDDCVDGLVSGLTRLVAGRVANETINLAYGQGRTLLDLATHLGRLLERRPSVVVEAKRVGEVTRYVANLDKARSLLDYVPKVGLEEGLECALAWQGEWAAERLPLRSRSG